MIANQGVVIINSDTVLKGEIRNCRRLEVHGYVEGGVEAEAVHVHKDGKLFGTIKSDTADVHGTLQGEASIKNLMNIHTSGSVIGNVRYGRLAMEPGAELSAEVRNVPPSLAGDFDLTVSKGRSVPITLQDLSALDPDDNAQDLTFTVSNARGGFVALMSAPTTPVSQFTQADLESRQVSFKHDGGPSTTASFDVVVSDRAGATSGAAQTVRVGVKA